ncbi:MAG: type II toxin-antitoxin system YafQ family toxin [Ruminococcus sp.]
MLTIKYHKSFKKDYKKIQKQGYDLAKLEAVITLLAAEAPLPEQYRDNALKGNYIGFRECHIQPDWLLIYQIEQDVLILTLSRTGSHSELFGK